MVASALSAWIIRGRVGSWSMSINTVSAVRRPGSKRAAARPLRRKMAAQISSSADASTCTPISALRARPGRAPCTSSLRSVRIGSMAVARNAGSSAKAPVAASAAITRNTATRQSAAGTLRFTSPMSSGTVRITPYTAPSSARREMRYPPAAAINASSTLSVTSWRTTRAREAPSDKRMPISR